MRLYEVWHYIDQCKIATFIVTESFASAERLWKSDPEHDTYKISHIEVDCRTLILDPEITASIHP